MNRREFVKNAGFAAVGAIAMPRIAPATYDFRTKHMIWIVNGNGSRKKDWYERPDLSPNYARLVKDGFVYTESHNDTVANHNESWSELITGNPTRSATPQFPTPLHYVRNAYGDEATNYWFVNGVDSYRRWRSSAGRLPASPVALAADNVLRANLKQTPSGIMKEEFAGMELNRGERKLLEDFVDGVVKARLWEFNLKHQPIARHPFIGDSLGLALIPLILKEFKPRMLIYHQVGHDAGHGDDGNGYAEYEKVCRTTDEQLGRIIDFVQNDPYFSTNTAIVIRPEFGRDDEISKDGKIHHSDGYMQTMRSAEIWYGPDFKAGISNRVTNRRDVVPSIARLFNVETPYATGMVHSEMFRNRLSS